MAGSDVPCCEPMFWAYACICVALVVFAGLMSGLNLGLMSLSLVDLEILIRAGQPRERKNAEKILPIVKNQHLLLCTLLVCNAMATEALPIFMDAILPPWGAILISVTLILAFGEIIPQAICSRYGLSVGAKISGVVWLLVVVVSPICYPVSKLLDLILGKEHSALLRRAELKTLVDMHGNEAGKGGELTHDETTIIAGALDLTQKAARDAMTPISKIFSLDLNSKLDHDLLSLILSKGHSRVPVYSGSPNNIIGLILVKNLIKCNPDDETPIRGLTIRKIPRFHDCLPLYDIMNQFQNGHSHMAVVVRHRTGFKSRAENEAVNSEMYKIEVNTESRQEQPEKKGTNYSNCQDKCPSSVLSGNAKMKNSSSDGKISNDILKSFSNSDEEIIGIITMEDVLEQLLQEPIFDETDEYVDVHNKIKVNMIPTIISAAASRSPAISDCHSNLHTPMASPLASDHQTPISSHLHTRSPVSPYHLRSPLRSPISPNAHSLFVRPTPTSPAKAIPSSSAASIDLVHSSPSSHWVSSRSYEKLRKAGESQQTTLGNSTCILKS